MMCLLHTRSVTWNEWNSAFIQISTETTSHTISTTCHIVNFVWDYAAPHCELWINLVNNYLTLFLHTFQTPLNLTYLYTHKDSSI